MSREYIIHTPDEIAKIRVAAAMAGRARDRIAEFVRPGMSTKELDMVAGEVIHSRGGIYTDMWKAHIQAKDSASMKGGAENV